MQSGSGAEESSSLGGVWVEPGGFVTLEKLEGVGEPRGGEICLGTGVHLGQRDIYKWWALEEARMRG